MGSGDRIRTPGASARDRKVRDVDREAAPYLEGFDKRRRLFGRDLPGRPTVDAMQVSVERIRQHVEFFATVRAVAVAEDAEFLQDVKRPVDRRWDRGWIERTAALDEFGTRHVAVRTRQDLDERSTLRGPA